MIDRMIAADRNEPRVNGMANPDAVKHRTIVCKQFGEDFADKVFGVRDHGFIRAVLAQRAHHGPLHDLRVISVKLRARPVIAGRASGDQFRR